MSELAPIQSLRDWYERELSEAFPECERKPLAEIEALIQAGRYETLGLYEGEELLGYATLWGHPDYPGYVLLDYLGVTAARRNSGLGAVILGMLRERFAGQALVITEAEAEVPGAPEGENALRRRRIAFYQRCGFAPVYETAACGARFQALVLGGFPADLSMLMEAHRAIYGPGRDDVEVPLSPGAVPKPPHWMKGRDFLDYKLVPMDRSHLPQVLEIERASFRHPWTEQIFADELYNDMASCIVAQAQDGSVLGYGEITVVLDEGCLEKIAVGEAYRRQGVAEEILGAFLRFGQVNLAFLTLEVRETNAPAIALYEKLGFRVVGRRKNYYAELHEDAILMTREFHEIGTV